MKTFVIDLNKCVGCYICQLVCKDEHVGNDWTPYAKPQPDTGQFWMKVDERIRGSVPKVMVSYLPTPCMHCEDAPCITECFEGAINRRDDGLVIIEPEKCTGCRNCVDACPYGVIYFNEDLYLAQKCTGCAHLLDQGWEEPRCVTACPTEALIFGEESDLPDLSDKTEVLHPEYGTRPRVFYIDLPKPFIGGSIFDPEGDECIEGASVSLLIDETDEIISTTLTDAFGDFWFRKLDVGAYSLLIKKDGYLPITVKDISTEKDVNVGDIALYEEAVLV